MLDKFDRRINYLRISVTDRCNLRCKYCMPEEGVTLKRHGDIISYEQMVAIAREAIGLGIKKIRLTGGEPLIRRGILSLVEQLHGLEGLEELTMTTNGVLLDEMAGQLKKAGLDRINISLDTLDAEKYRDMTRGGNIDRVMRGMEAVIAAGFENTKINMVVIPDFNREEVEAMRGFCEERGFRLQRINHYSLESIDSIDSDYVAERPLKCSQCNRVRLTADGKLKPCLFSDREIPVDFSDIRESLMQAIEGKPSCGTGNSTRHNYQIGG